MERGGSRAFPKTWNEGGEFLGGLEWDELEDPFHPKSFHDPKGMENSHLSVPAAVGIHGVDDP